MVDSSVIVLFGMSRVILERRRFTILRRHLRDESDPLSMPEERFKELFRVSKDLYNYLYTNLNPYLRQQSRPTKLPVELKILACLRFYATGCYQRSVGSNFLIAMSQTSISRVVEEVSEAIETRLCEKWIKFPSVQEFFEIQRVFYEKTRYPGIIGAIDGTHVELLKPKDNEHLYFNRKGKHSINAQIICDYNLKILAVNARYPGATHDSAIWEVCAEKDFVQRNWNNENNFHLIGDSGYPLQPWLMTPYRSPAEGSVEKDFNERHNSARNCVERCIGNLKAVFRCLLAERKLRYEPYKVTKIINACCALNNMRLAFRVATEEDVLLGEEVATEVDLPTTATNNSLRREAERIRFSLATSIRSNTRNH